MTFSLLILLFIGILQAPCRAQSVHADKQDTKTLRVFIFAGQSNMVGSDSDAHEVDDFPPFLGCGEEQPKIKYSYAIGRETMRESNGWSTLQPVDNVVGPELSFGRTVSAQIKAPIAIIKCAAGGTTLGTDWNPDDPGGFKLYPLALKLVKDSLKELDKKRIKYRVEGFMWHQGENDMFHDDFKANYAANLRNFIASWRRDLELPDLPFYIGELSCKTVWGMDNRANMYAISVAQKQVCESDERVEYIATNHVGVTTKGNNGLHYHYGTLGQLEHGANYASAYLKNIGQYELLKRTFKKWPFKEGSAVKLFVLAGHRNMEGEISFVDDLKKTKHAKLRKDNGKIPFSYSLAGGFKASAEWEPLGPAGLYGTFGPELSFASNLHRKVKGDIAIAKFTHSGSQVIDWTPNGSDAESRNLYPSFIAFIQEQIKSLEDRGHKVELAGIFYHLGENDMSFGQYKSKATAWVRKLVDQSRRDLNIEDLPWFLSQQPPIQFEGAADVDVTKQLQDWAEPNESNFHIEASGLVKKDEHILMDSEGVVGLGLLLSNAFLNSH
ncbi:MAG: sialate O-acetylesterase [Planctomycetota bacterium]|jgi:hypothetical protein